MPALVWSDAMSHAQPDMDTTHREFVDRLTAVEHALDHDPDQVAPSFGALLDHTKAHFSQEERWMGAIGLVPENGHADQHRHVLDVLHEVRGVIGQTGDAQILRRLISELASWFVAHAQMMDAVLAETMLACGFDTETGTAARPLTGNAGGA